MCKHTIVGLEKKSNIFLGTLERETEYTCAQRLYVHVVDS